jgi:polysaccharide export outer membrane protein
MSLFFSFLVGTVSFAKTSAQFSESEDGSDTLTAGSSDTGLQYIIGPGDVLQVSVWKETDFTVSVNVRFDGKVTLPLVGDVQAEGRTPEQLGGDLEQRLSEYIELPQVTVSVTEPNSARYFVIGKVGKQGAYPFTGPVTVVQALALAEGFQEFAKRDKVFVIRVENGKQIGLQVEYDRLEGGKDLESNILLQPGDTIVVP